MFVIPLKALYICGSNHWAKSCPRFLKKMHGSHVIKDFLQLNSYNSNLQGDSKFVRITWVFEL